MFSQFLNISCASKFQSNSKKQLKPLKLSWILKKLINCLNESDNHTLTNWRLEYLKFPMEIYHEK